MKRTFFNALVRTTRRPFIGRPIVPREVCDAGNGRVFEVVLRVVVVYEYAHALLIDAIARRGQQAIAEIFSISIIEKKVGVFDVPVIGDSLSPTLPLPRIPLPRKGLAVTRRFVLRCDNRKIEGANPPPRFDAKQPASIAATKSNQARTGQSQRRIARLYGFNNAVLIACVLQTQTLGQIKALSFAILLQRNRDPIANGAFNSESGFLLKIDGGKTRCARVNGLRLSQSVLRETRQFDAAVAPYGEIGTSFSSNRTQPLRDANRNFDIDYALAFTILIHATAQSLLCKTMGIVVELIAHKVAQTDNHRQAIRCAAQIAEHHKCVSFGFRFYQFRRGSRIRTSSGKIRSGGRRIAQKGFKR